jgi:hypothetical protein
VLWPYLFEFLVPIEYTEAIPTLCRCLTFLADKFSEAESDNYDVDFDVGGRGRCAAFPFPVSLSSLRARPLTPRSRCK